MNDNYSNQLAAKEAACISSGMEMSNRNPTVAENIDIKIKALQTEIDRLEASKIALAPLMNMRIRDIRDAMSF